MSHEYHEDLSGFVPGALFQDGCPECEARCKRGIEATSSLGPERVRELWRRAGLAYDKGCLIGPGLAAQEEALGTFRTSACEYSLYPAVQAVQRLLERAEVGVDGDRLDDLPGAPGLSVFPGWLADTRGRS